MWSVASLEKTWANSAYSAGRVFLGFSALAFIARSVDMVSLLTVTVVAGVRNLEPHHWIRLIMKESTACSVNCSESSVLRYRQRLAFSVGFKVVSLRGLTLGVCKGQVFLLRYFPRAPRWAKESSRDWSLVSEMVTVPLFQSMEGLVPSSQGCPRMMFSFPLLIA